MFVWAHCWLRPECFNIIFKRSCKWSWRLQCVSLSLPGFLQEDHQTKAGVRQVWTQLQDPKEEPQQVPVLPIPQVPLCGHVPQRYGLKPPKYTTQNELGLFWDILVFHLIIYSLTFLNVYFVFFGPKKRMWHITLDFYYIFLLNFPLRKMSK